MPTMEPTTTQRLVVERERVPALLVHHDESTDRVLDLLERRDQTGEVASVNTGADEVDHLPFAAQAGSTLDQDDLVTCPLKEHSGR